MLSCAHLAEMVKLVDTRDLKSLAFGHAGSIPALGTNKKQVQLRTCFFIYELRLAKAGIEREGFGKREFPTFAVGVTASATSA